MISENAYYCPLSPDCVCPFAVKDAGELCPCTSCEYWLSEDGGVSWE